MGTHEPADRSGATPARRGHEGAAGIRAGRGQGHRDPVLDIGRGGPVAGQDAQNTFAIAVAGRGFDARISTEFDVGLPDSACVYCGNCIGVCPTGALMFESEHDMRQAGTWDESRQTVTTTICPYCGVGCNLELHVQDNRIVKVTSPLDHDVGNGHLCVKGRFGFEFVQRRAGEP
jgi:predicted molibdopterin-dependent oxidoreductase YjgC